MERRWLGRLLVGAALALAAIPALTAPAAASGTGSLNDWSCRPAAPHPLPVVLVHGTFENQIDNWTGLAPLLLGHGYCVFALDYGQAPGGVVGGVGPIEQSAGELSSFVERVLSATGAPQVDIVGHSQGGGVLPRYYLEFLQGAPRVHSLIGLAPSNHGTTVDGLITLADQLGVRQLSDGLFGVPCPACVEQFTGSDFLARMNARPDTVPGVRYTVIETRFDEVVTPYTSAFLSGPAVENILLQDRCPLDLVDHVGISYDPIALAYVLDALDPTNAHPPGCL
jgi:triacylglycerol esterase/lipase EstA (alpha/beta hydrolase family)